MGPELHATVTVLERALAALGAGVVAHGPAGKVVYASTHARHLTTAYLGAALSVAEQLPRQLRAVARSSYRAKRDRGITIDADRGRLFVRALPARGRTPGLLVLSEHRGEAPDAEALAVVGLTPRQTEVLRLVAAGYDDEDVGAELNISPGTVRKHLESVYKRLGARNRTEAVLKALGVVPS